MYYVYILYSASLNSFYKGQTGSLSKRLNQHNSLLNTSMKQGAPWMLVWTTQKPSRSEALILEKKLKNLSFDRTIQFILKYKDGINSKEAHNLVINFFSHGRTS